MNMDEYLNTVTEQIRCKKMIDPLAEELKTHILDQAEAYEAEGETAEQAMERAVQDMGDPVETGIALDRIHRPHFSWELLVLTGILSVLNLLIYWTLYTAAGDTYDTGYYLGRQIRYVALGAVCMAAVCRLDYSILKDHGRTAAAGILGLLICCLVFGLPINGGIYGLRIGMVTISCGALLNLYVPVYGALLYHYRGSGYEGIGKLLLWAAAPICLAVRIPSLNRALMLGILLVILFTLAVRSGWYQVDQKLVLGGFWGALLILPAVMILTGNLSTYQMARLHAFFYAGDPSGNSYQAVQAANFLSSSQWLGSSGKSFWETLPGYEAEYILVSISSIYGILAAAAVVALLVLLCIRMIQIALHQKNQLGKMIGCACGLELLMQCLLTIGVNVGLVPVTGAVLPFFSAGGTNLVSSYILLGLVLSIYRYQDILPHFTENKCCCAKMTG